MPTATRPTPTQSLTHHLPLRRNFLVQLTLPADLTQAEADRISALLDILVRSQDEEVDDDGTWPFKGVDDPDGDLDAAEIEASDSDDFPDVDLPNDDDDDIDEFGQTIDKVDGNVPPSKS